MDLSELRGVWPAAIVPFDERLDIDHDALRSHLDNLIGVPGVQAVVVNGHAGEVSSLSHEEQLTVSTIASEVADQRVAVVVGVYGHSTDECIRLATAAEKANADGILLFPPPMFSTGAQYRDVVPLNFVTDVARATSLPIALFQLPVRAGLGYTTPVLQKLCGSIDSIRAIKEGSDDPVLYERNWNAIKEINDEILVLTTNNAWLLESLIVGADGILSGMGSIASDLLSKLHMAVESGDIAAARDVNSRIFALTEVFYRDPLLDMHNRMKAGLQYLGRIPDARVRPPLVRLDQDEISRVEEAVRHAGLS